MSDSHYTLKEVLDEAQYVRVSDDSFVTVVWYGGPMFEVYRRSSRHFKVLEAITIGKGDSSEIPQEEAEESIEEYIEDRW